MIRLSIIIPTYNRPRALKRCLTALLQQNTSMDACEIIIVDNGIDNQTQVVVKIFQNKFSHCVYVHESRVGLSVAKNVGSNLARGKWILFLDDDGIAKPGLVKQCFRDISERKADIIGGIYYPLHTSIKPRWFTDSMGSNVIRNRTHKFRFLEKNEFASGGIMLLHKTVIEKVGRFPDTIGMIGTKTGYGEETFFQIGARNIGYKVAFDPLLVMDHEVQKYKYSLRWQLKSSWLMGKDQVFLLPHSFRLIANRFFGVFVVGPISAINKFFTSRDYYYQNLILDIFQPILYFSGQLVGIYKIF